MTWMKKLQKFLLKRQQREYEQMESGVENLPNLRLVNPAFEKAFGSFLVLFDIDENVSHGIIYAKASKLTHQKS
jgi:hypothetical protein